MHITYFNKFLIPRKAKGGSLLLEMSDLAELLFFVCLFVYVFDLQIASKTVGTLTSLKIFMCWVGQKAQEETQYWNAWYGHALHMGLPENIETLLLLKL